VAAARAAIEAKGGRVLNDAVNAYDSKSVALIVTFPEADRDRAMNAVSDLDLRVRFLPVRTSYATRVGNLRASPEGLRGKGPQGEMDLPLARILAVRTLANVQIPEDALLLREGERPSEYLKTLIVGAFLLAFALINLLALRARA
jgi:hypothetical protein